MKTSKEKKGIIDHTFAICAYKESEFLEECILSLVNQTVKTNIIMATSTTNDYIKNLANKYQIPLFIRNGKSDIRDGLLLHIKMTDIIRLMWRKCRKRLWV